MKNINHLKIIIFSCLTALFVASFNNCSDVQFSPDETTQLSSENRELLAEEGSLPEEILILESEDVYDPTQSDIDFVLDLISQDEINMPRPVSDLETDPSLFEIYKCRDGSSVLICHFPDNVEAQGSKCVGRNAASTHYNHIRVYDLGEGVRSATDYLGPCRLPL